MSDANVLLWACGRCWRVLAGHHVPKPNGCPTCDGLAVLAARGDVKPDNVNEETQ